MIFTSKPFDDSFDSEFAKITKIKWYPYVGSNYRCCPYKVIIIGESHYADKCESYEDPQYKTQLKLWQSIYSTRDCIIEERFEAAWENKTYTNITALLSGTPRAIPENTWSHIAFYNLIQELLPSILFRPTYSQFEEGVMILPKIIKILQPDICIIIGVGARKILQANYGSSYNELHTIIRNSYPFQIEIGNTPVIAFPHISRTGLGGMPKYRNTLMSVLPSSRIIINYFTGLSNTSLSECEKRLIFHSSVFKKILSELLNQYDFLESVRDEREHDGTPYFGFNVRNNDFILAFNFWEKDFIGLTVGLHFPKGFTNNQKTHYSNIFKKSDGWEVKSPWIFYDVYRLYNWNNTVFDGIKDGSIRLVFQKIIDDFKKILKDNNLI